MASKLVSHVFIAFVFFPFFAISMAKEEEKFITFEEGWPKLQEAFNNLTSMAEGSTSYRVTSDAYMSYYSIVYNACAANPATASQFYSAYKTNFEDYISSKILPSLQEARKEELVARLVKSWWNYKLVTRWFSKFLNYLNRYYVPENHLPSLQQTSYFCFYDKVYGELNDQIKDAISSMIHCEKMGKKIDEKLLEDVQTIYNEMRSVQHAHYSEDLDDANRIHSFKPPYAMEALVQLATTTTSSDSHEYTQKVV